MILVISTSGCADCAAYKAKTEELFVEYCIGVTKSVKLNELGTVAMALAAMVDLTEMPILAELHDGKVVRVGKPDGKGGVEWVGGEHV